MCTVYTMLVPRIGHSWHPPHCMCIASFAAFVSLPTPPLPPSLPPSLSITLNTSLFWTRVAPLCPAYGGENSTC